MSAYTMAQAWAPITAAQKEAVYKETWGHLAPKKNFTYQGRIVYAVGCFGSDPLNPTVIYSEFADRKSKELDSSPWFFDALMDLVGEQENEDGCVYEMVGTFRNYEFTMSRRKCFDSKEVQTDET